VFAVVLLSLAILGALVYVAMKPAYDRARADREKVMASDGGAYIGGHLTVPK